jgi:hypothetical protein
MSGAGVTLGSGRLGGRFRGCRDCDSALADSQSAGQNGVEVE